MIIIKTGIPRLFHNGNPGKRRTSMPRFMMQTRASYQNKHSKLLKFGTETNSILHASAAHITQYEENPCSHHGEMRVVRPTDRGTDWIRSYIP